MSNYPSSMRKVKCRFCGEELREKNYKNHLLRKHPDENASDKRSAGQKSIFSFAKPSLIGVEKDSTKNIPSVSALSTSEDETRASLTENVPSLAENVPSFAENLTPDSVKSDLFKEKSADEIKVYGTENEKLDEILAYVKNLEQKLEDMQCALKNENSNAAASTSTKNEVYDYETDLNYIFQSCRSISDITSFFDEFAFYENDGTIICRLCAPDRNGALLPERKGNCHPSVFSYDVENGINFPIGINLPPKFRNLKRHLKDHLLSNLHKKSVDLIEDIDKEKNKHATRETDVGLRIGRIAYRLYYKGRPYVDFEDEIALNIQNGCDMGDINHSIAFAKKFLSYVSIAVRNRLKVFLNDRLVQTGFQPPLKIIADKATWKHRTRQFIMAITIVPDSDELIQALFLGHPVVKTHNGQGVADSIVSCIAEYGITKTQYNGGSFDGQYFKLSVPDYLNKHFSEEEDKTYYYDWDPMHKAGLVDDHLRKNAKFSWIVAIAETIASIFGEFNYGKEYENLRDVSCQLSMQETHGEQNNFKNPCFFSETRFANHCKKVYQNFREDFKAIVTVFEERQMDSIGGSSVQREKAASANVKMNKILNVKFCLRLSGLCDLYDHFSKIICDLQKLDILPHERYAQFISRVDCLQSMSLAVDFQKCPCSRQCQRSQNNCFWPTYHADSKALEAGKTYQGIPLCETEPENFNNTRSSSKRIKINPITCKQHVDSELSELSLHVAEELKKVFTEEEIKVFEHVKVLTDLKFLATKVKVKGVVLTAASEIEKYLVSAKTLVYDFKDISDSQLESQYRMFLSKIQGIVGSMTTEEYQKMTSKHLIQTFLSTKQCLFQGIELIMHSICVASTISTVESVCESLTSTYEFHNNRRRPISEEAAQHEMMIAVNGPLPTNCDMIISEAMNSYFTQQKDWHFVRRTNNLKDWTISKCADKLLNKHSSLPFMDR